MIAPRAAAGYDPCRPQKRTFAGGGNQSIDSGREKYMTPGVVHDLFSHANAVARCGHAKKAVLRVMQPEVRRGRAERESWVQRSCGSVEAVKVELWRSVEGIPSFSILVIG